jgi:hypothetical protein
MLQRFASLLLLATASLVHAASDVVPKGVIEGTGNTLGYGELEVGDSTRVPSVLYEAC